MSVHLQVKEVPPFSPEANAVLDKLAASLTPEQVILQKGRCQSTRVAYVRKPASLSISFAWNVIITGSHG